MEKDHRNMSSQVRRGVLEALPLDGGKIRSQDLFKRLLQEGISKTTALPHLKRMMDENIIGKSGELVNNRPAVFYRLLVDGWSAGMSREYADLTVHEVEEGCQLFAEGTRGYRSQKDLEEFFYRHLNGFMQLHTGQFFRACDAAICPYDSLDEVKNGMEAFNECITRRWMTAIAQVVWVTRDRAERPFLRAVWRIRLASGERPEAVRALKRLERKLAKDTERHKQG